MGNDVSLVGLITMLMFFGVRSFLLYIYCTVCEMTRQLYSWKTGLLLGCVLAAVQVYLQYLELQFQ